VTNVVKTKWTIFFSFPSRSKTVGSMPKLRKKRKWSKSTFLQCSECNKPNVVCFKCRYMGNKCEDHAKDFQSYGGHCHTESLDQEKMYYCTVSRVKGSYSKCIDTPKCVNCLENNAIKNCAGYDTFEKSGSKEKGDYKSNWKPYRCEKEQPCCETCSDWVKDPFQKYQQFRCPECHDNYVEYCKCEACGKPSKTSFTCDACEQSFCDHCNKSTTVDVSPVTIFGYGFSVGRYWDICKGCMKGKSEKYYQDIARRYSGPYC